MATDWVLWSCGRFVSLGHSTAGWCQAGRVRGREWQCLAPPGGTLGGTLGGFNTLSGTIIGTGLVTWYRELKLTNNGNPQVTWNMEHLPMTHWNLKANKGLSLNSNVDQIDVPQPLLVDI